MSIPLIDYLDLYFSYMFFQYLWTKAAFYCFFQDFIHWSMRMIWSTMIFVLVQIWPVWTIWWTEWANLIMWNIKENKSNVGLIAKTKLIHFLWLPVLIPIEKPWYIVKSFVFWPKDFCKNVRGLKRDLWKGSIRICVPLLNHWCDWNLLDFAKIMLGIYREAWCQIVPIQGMYAFYFTKRWEKLRRYFQFGLILKKHQITNPKGFTLGTIHKGRLLKGVGRWVHGLRKSNEGINQRYLKNWADVADKICFGRT